MTSPSPVTPAVAPRRILFIDDDTTFLDMATQVFGELSKGSWEVLTASDSGTAQRLLRQQTVHVAVLDLTMPEISGLELIRILNRDCPNMPKVFLTGAADTGARLEGLEAGAELFLEKPTGLDGLQSVYATLNELLKWHEKQGARGVVRPANLVELVKLECISGNSRVIEVTAGSAQGSIYIKEGSITHAETEGRRGQSAFTFLASHPDAEFVLRQYTEPVERSVIRQWEFLIMEAFQLREQLTQAAADLRRKETAAPAAEPEAKAEADTSALRQVVDAATGRQPSPPPAKPGPKRPAPARPPAPSPSAPPAATLAVAAAAPPAAAPVEAAPASEPAEAPPALEPAPAWLRLAQDPPSREIRIDEMLVASAQGEILYEWHCPKSDARLREIDSIRQKSTLVTQRIPALGQARRVEVQALQGRLIVRFMGETILWISAASRAKPAGATVSPFNRPFGDWLAQQSHVTGLLGCGVVRPTLAPLNCSYASEFPADGLAPLWRVAGEILDGVRRQQFDAWLLRWLFDSTQLYFLRRFDGLALGALIAQDSAEVEAQKLENMFGEFSALVGA